MEPKVTYGNFRTVAQANNCSEQLIDANLDGEGYSYILIWRKYGDQNFCTAIPSNSDVELMAWELLRSDARILGIPMSEFGDGASRYALAEGIIEEINSPTPDTNGR